MTLALSDLDMRLGSKNLTWLTWPWVTVNYRLGLAMVNLSAKFEVSISDRYEDRKGVAKSRS